MSAKMVEAQLEAFEALSEDEQNEVKAFSRGQLAITFLSIPAAMFVLAFG